MTWARRALATIAALTLLAVAAAAPARADTVGNVQAGQQKGFALPQEDPLSPRIFRAQSLTIRPRYFGINGRQAIRIGEQTDAVREARRKHPGLRPVAYLSPLLVEQGHFWHWDIMWVDRQGKQVVEAEVGPNGGVLTTTSGIDIGWPLLKGLPGVLGKKLNAPYIWLPLCLLFVLPFVDPRRPRRLLHLDLAMLLGFGVSQFFFTRGNPGLSVPLVYPFLLYAAIRAGFAAFRPARRAGPLIPYVSTRLLGILLVVLIALRIAFGAFGSEPFDIGRAGAIGADRIEHGLQLYVDNDAHGDTYGPVNYLLYVPAELVFPYRPGHEQAPIAATLMFDLLLIAGLFQLGRSLRRGPDGTRLGVALAYAWAAFPYSALILAADTNDALVPLFIVYALLALRSPPGRGILAGLGTMAKFAPGLVAPALIVGRGPFRWRPVLIGSACFAAVCIGSVLLFLPDGGIKEFWNTTLGFQLHRTSPLSLWDRHPGLGWLKTCFVAIAALLGVVAAFVPRRRTVGQLAALSAAILAAVQIPGSYWIYFYVAWWSPFLLVALFEEYRELGPGQESVTSSLVKPEMISQPSSVTATRSSIRTPSTPGR